jgi:kynurenine formamidase
VAVLAWDMMDALPDPEGLPWSVHGALYALGLALLDNCALGELAEVCRAEGRSDFMFVAAPLRVARGTGSPVNPLAVL